jgi:AcrR family transcriptional regulator
MGRPIDIDKRLELARDAIAVLLQEGLDLSMARLAEALGMKRPTLLYYFPDKAAIAVTALEDLLTQQAMFVLEHMGRHDHPLDQIYAQVQAIHAFHHGNETRIIFLAQAIASASRERMQLFIEVGNRVFEPHRLAMIERLRCAMADGTMRPCDPEALMQLVRCVNDGLIVQRVMTNIELGPAHELFWKHVLEPLKVEPTT